MLKKLAIFTAGAVVGAVGYAVYDKYHSDDVVDETPDDDYDDTPDEDSDEE